MDHPTKATIISWTQLCVLTYLSAYNYFHKIFDISNK